MTHKLIFLDIDGVMNSEVSWLRYQNYGTFSENAVNSLNSILSRTGAKIVISSSWREIHPYKEMEAILCDQGVHAHGRVIGQTPSWNKTSKGNILCGFKCRGDEIHNWLENYDGKVEGIVLLDDTMDMVHMYPWLVLTNAYVGLTKADADLAVSILDQPFDIRLADSFKTTFANDSSEGCLQDA